MKVLMSIKSKPATKRKPEPPKRGKSKPTLSTPQADDPAPKQQLRQRVVWLLNYHASRLHDLLSRLRLPVGSVAYAQIPDQLQRELRFATDYWLEWVQRHIAGRKLRGVELYVAEDAYLLLEKARDNAARWNDLPEGRPAPITLPDLADSAFRKPEPLYAEDFPPPETLATIAAPLLPKPETPLSAEDAVRRACALFSAAQQYRESLPHKPPPGQKWEADFHVALCSYVTVAEIHESNKANSGSLPLLPALRVRRKGMEDPNQKDPKRITGAQTRQAILRTMLDFTKERIPRITEEEFNREQEQMEKNIKAGLVIRLGNPDGKPQTWQEWQKDWQQSIDDVKQNHHLCVHSLCTLRRHQFQKEADRRSAIAAARQKDEARKTAKRATESATKRDRRP